MKAGWWVLCCCDLYWMVLCPSMPLDWEKQVWPALAFWLVSINHSSWLRSSPRAAEHDSLVTQHSQQQKEWSGTAPKSNCRRIFLRLREMLWARHMHESTCATATDLYNSNNAAPAAKKLALPVLTGAILIFFIVSFFAKRFFSDMLIWHLNKWSQQSPAPR